MPASPDQLVRHLRQLAGDSESDAVLLQRFVSQRDERAFEVLVQRYGPMVLRVCRRVLADPHTAEDAFQAAFLVLARRASTIARPASLAAWLHGVALRVARNARRGPRPASLAGHDAPAPSRDPLAELTGRELLAVLDEEVARLPERYRLPVVLCCLEGHTQEEAAARLGLSRGALCGRLARGRSRLHARLARRGLGLSIVLPAIELSRALTVPPVLAQSTARAGLLFTAGSVGAIPVRVLALAEAGLPGLSAGRVLAALALVLGLIWAGTSLLARHQGPPGSPVRAAAAPAAAQPPTDRLGDPLPPAVLARMGTLRRRHPGVIAALAYSPDGKVIAAGGLDSDVYLWSAATGKELRRLGGHGPGVAALAWSPDGKDLAVAGQSLHLWAPATGKRLRTFPATPGALRAVTFSKDGTAVAAGGYEGAWLWDRQGRLRGEFRAGKEGTLAVALSPDGKYLATGADRDGAVRLWSTASRKEVRRFLGHEGEILAVLFSADGSRLVSSGRDQTTRVWEVATGKQVRRHAGQLNGGALALSSDGKRLALSASGEGAAIVDLASGKEQQRLGGKYGPIRALAFSRDGARLAFAGWDQAARLWDVESKRELLPPGGLAQGISAVVVTPDGRTVVTAEFDGPIRLWEATTGKMLRELAAFERGAHSLAISPTGGTLAAASLASSRVRLWRLPGGKELPPFTAHAEGVCSLAFSPDGTLLLTGGKDHAARLWSVAGWKARHTWADLGDDVHAVAFAPDGRLAAVAAGSGPCIRLWDTTTGRLVARFGNHAGAVTKLAFSPDGRLLLSSPLDSMIALAAAADEEDSIRLWEVSSGREVRRLRGGGGVAWGAAFSPDGRCLLTGDDSHRLSLWEVSTGRLRTQAKGHRSRVGAVAFFPDGRRLVSASHDSTALVWDRDALVRRQAGKTATDRALWQALARDDEAGGAPIGALLANAPRAVTLLKAHLKPARPVAAARLDRLVADLDSSNFDTRQRAERELERLAFLTEPRLRKALAGKPPLEMHRRIDRLLRALDRQRLAPTGEALRLLRAVEVLERLGTPTARAVLEGLASGPRGDRAAEEASAALRRLRARSRLEGR